MKARQTHDKDANRHHEHTDTFIHRPRDHAFDKVLAMGEK